MKQIIIYAELSSIQILGRYTIIYSLGLKVNIFLFNVHFYIFKKLKSWHFVMINFSETYLTLLDRVHIQLNIQESKR